MWNELLDAPFITSAEKQAFSPYYAQACANKWPANNDVDAATPLATPVSASVASAAGRTRDGWLNMTVWADVSPPPLILQMDLSVQYGAQSISFVNPCNSAPCATPPRPRPRPALVVLVVLHPRTPWRHVPGIAVRYIPLTAQRVVYQGALQRRRQRVPGQSNRQVWWPRAGRTDVRPPIVVLRN